MLNDLTADTQVYLVTGYTDLRRGIDGLATIVQGQLELDPFSKALFLYAYQPQLLMRLIQSVQMLRYQAGIR